MSALLSILFERKLAIMLPEEVQELLVVVRIHVEQLHDDLVASASLLETALHEVPDIRLGDLTLHVEWVDRRPERLPIIDKLLIELVGYSAPPLASGSEGHVAFGPNLHRKIVDGHHFSPSADDHTLDNVRQLADVAGPGVVGKGGHGVGRDRTDRRIRSSGEEVQKMPGQNRDIATAIAQRWNHKMDDVEAVKQVFTELTFADHVA